MSGGWRDLLVWKKSHSLVLQVYELVRVFPKSESFVLIDQIKRSVISIPTNIVEGHSKKSKKDFMRYLLISRGSLEELRYLLLLSKDLNYLREDVYNNIESNLSEISYLLNNLIKSLSKTKNINPSTPSTPSTPSNPSIPSTPSISSTPFKSLKKGAKNEK